MTLKLCFSLASILMIRMHASAQEDSLTLLPDNQPETEKVYSAFKSSRVIMSHSIEMLRPGVLDFRILHRFGNVNLGIKEFFGLDQATIRLGLDYGISNNLTIGIGRGSYKKELDGFLKYRAIQQTTGQKVVPFSLVLIAGSTINAAPYTDRTRKNYFSSRFGYYGQAILGRKFSEKVTLQLMPIIVHQNLVTTLQDPNDLFGAGIGGRLKITKRLALTTDYYYVLNKNKNLDDFHNPLSIGFDIETGGHVFQLHFTNAIGMNERAFLTETTNDWSKGDIQFGFNISRVFQISKKNRQSR